MSWSIWGVKIDTTDPKMEESFRAAVTARVDEQKALNPTLALFEDQETKEQLEATISLALAAVGHHAKALGGTAFNVSMNGHSNPNHEKRDGYSNDCFAISVCAT